MIVTSPCWSHADASDELLGQNVSVFALRQLCVDVDGPTTILQNPPEMALESGKGKAGDILLCAAMAKCLCSGCTALLAEEAKKFTFDASFWSLNLTKRQECVTK